MLSGRGMNLRDILVILDADAASEGRLALAVNIARGQGACLDALFLPAGPTAKSFGGFAASWRWPATTHLSRDARTAGLAEQRFHDFLGSCGIEGEWHTLDRPGAAGMLCLARAADLTIIGQANPDTRSGSAWRPEEIVTACGRPVLLIPYVGRYAHTGRRVLVAWDASREAVRALNDALPLIGNAQTVTLLNVRARDRDFGQDRSSTRCALRHLARHGIAARSEERVSGGDTACDVLLNRAADLGADLIIAGGCCRSRLHEALGGGVSRGLFRHMTAPVLMSR